MECLIVVMFMLAGSLRSLVRLVALVLRLIRRPLLRRIGLMVVLLMCRIPRLLPLVCCLIPGLLFRRGLLCLRLLIRLILNLIGVGFPGMARRCCGRRSPRCPLLRVVWWCRWVLLLRLGLLILFCCLIRLSCGPMRMLVRNCVSIGCNRLLLRLLR